MTKLVELWLSPSFDLLSIKEKLYSLSFTGFIEKLKKDLDKIDEIFDEKPNKISKVENKIRSKAYSNIFSELDKNSSRLKEMYSSIFENIKKDCQKRDVDSEELEKLKKLDIFLFDTICYVENNLDLIAYEDINKRLNSKEKHLKIINLGLFLTDFKENVKYLLNLHNFFLEVKSNLESKLMNEKYEVTEESFKECDNALILLNFIYKFQKKELGKIISGKSESDKLLFSLVFCINFYEKYIEIWNKIGDIVKKCVKNSSDEKLNFTEKLLNNYFFYSASFNPVQYDLDSEINDICKKRVENLYREYEKMDFFDREIQFKFLQEFKEQLFWLNEEFQIARKRYFCALEYMCKYKKNEKFFYSLGIDMFQVQMDVYNEIYKECEDFFRKMTEKIPSNKKKEFNITPENKQYFFKSRIEHIGDNCGMKKNEQGCWLINPTIGSDLAGCTYRYFLNEKEKLINALKKKKSDELSKEVYSDFFLKLKDLFCTFIKAKKIFNENIEYVKQENKLTEITEAFHPLYIYEAQKLFINNDFYDLWLEIEGDLQGLENDLDVNQLLDIYYFFSVLLYDFQCDIEHEENSFFEDFYRSYFENYKL